MENKGIARAISEFGDIISDLREVIRVKDWREEKLSEEIASKNARIKELEDMLSKRPERIKREGHGFSKCEDTGLNKWNK